MAGFYNGLIIWNGYILVTVHWSLLSTGLFCERALYGTKLHWFIEPVD